MKCACVLLAWAAFCPAGAFAGEAVKPSIPAKEQPGEKIASEDPRLPNFHRVELGSTGCRIYRSASPVRDLVKGKPVKPDSPEAVGKARQTMDYLKGLGIRTIVSLEDPVDDEKEGRKSVSVELERTAAGSAGIAFHSHPMRNARFKDMAPGAILDWLKDVEADIRTSTSQGGVLFHCAAGHDRTGLVGAYLRITTERWTVDRAIAEMRALGHNWVKYSSNGGVSSWHEDFLRRQFEASLGAKP